LKVGGQEGCGRVIKKKKEGGGGSETRGSFTQRCAQPYAMLAPHCRIGCGES